MELSRIQRRVMDRLAPNRSGRSYGAGGLVLNKNWPRRSDDIDIVPDADEHISASIDRDIETLRDAGFGLKIDLKIRGATEATVTDFGEETVIQWMSETCFRSLPLVESDEWGVRLASADIAINRFLAMGSRRKARDVVDLVSIGAFYCPLGPLAMAAAGKPLNRSPLRLIEDIRRNAFSIPNTDFEAVRGIPDKWTTTSMRDRMIDLIGKAETYVRTAPVEVAGRLALSSDHVPVEVRELTETFELRAATSEPEVMPEFKNLANRWPKTS